VPVWGLHSARLRKEAVAERAGRGGRLYPTRPGGLPPSDPSAAEPGMLVHGTPVEYLPKEREDDICSR